LLAHPDPVPVPGTLRACFERSAVGVWRYDDQAWSTNGRCTMPERPAYPTDLTDAEWAILEPHVPAPKSGGRPVTHPRREICNAIFYVLRSGGAWRLLPHELPPW